MLLYWCFIIWTITAIIYNVVRVWYYCDKKKGDNENEHNSN